MKIKRKRKTKRKYIWCTAIAILLLLITGLLFLLNPIVKNSLVNNISTNETLNIPIRTHEEIKADPELEITYNFEDIRDINTADVIRAQRELSNSNSNIPVVGRIRVPSVNIDLAIIEGVSNTAMSAGAGTLKPNQTMGEGNFVLSSHTLNNPNLLFSPLHRLELGETIYLYNGEQTFRYIITEKEVIEPTRVDVIEDVLGETLITLITCADNGSTRLMVRGELVN